MKINHTFRFYVAFLLSAFSVHSLPAGVEKSELVINTADGFKISATLSRPGSEAKRLPAVVLIHQGGSDRTEWNSFSRKLLAQNYVTLAYDVRGHGKSDSVKSIYALFNDPGQAPLDLQAVLRKLRSLDFVDNKRIAIVGSSIGANLACVAAGVPDYGVKTAVAISGKTSAVYNLAGVKGHDNLAMRSVFLISSLESNGARAGWAKELYDQTGEPRQVKIIDKSEAHGVGIFEDAPEVESDIIKWLHENL